MLTRATQIKLAIFAVVGALVIAYTGVHYASLGRYLGLRGYYVVHLQLANGGGIFTNADVTYRGVSVGRVGAMRLTAGGVEVDLNISDSAPPIPARLTAAVADLSAVGEQYVDLRPSTSNGPYLANGSVISQRDTRLPLPVTSLLTSINSLALSLPLTQMRSVIGELATSFNGEGRNLQSLLDGSRALSQAQESTVNQAKQLIDDSRTVMSTQVAEARALESFSAGAHQLAARLVASNSDLRRFISVVPQAAGQLDGLLRDTNPSLAVLIANLLTTSEVTMTRGQALEELLSALPADVAAGSTVINSKGARFGVALTFFTPLPCIAGYGGTQYRNGLDTSPRPLNTGARCDLPASSGVDVRGSANAPSGGPVPSPASPGFASLLGVTP